MEYETAKIFRNGTEYEIFRDNYCESGCIHHKERDDGLTEFTRNGGCPIENLLEDARFDGDLFPNVILEVWDGEKCLNWYHCPFYTAYDPDKVVEQLEELKEDAEWDCEVALDDRHKEIAINRDAAFLQAIEIVKKGGVE